MGHLSRDAPSFTEADIDDAIAFFQERPPPLEDEDMLDDILHEEELGAVFASYGEQRASGTRQPSSLAAIDEREYDELFAELISQDAQQQYFHDQVDNSMDHDMTL